MKKIIFALFFVLVCVSAFSQTTEIAVKNTETGFPSTVTAEYPFPVFSPSKIDTGNSTKIPLASAAVFTGDSCKVLDYSGVAILVGSNVAGVLMVQYSPDAVDWYDGETYVILAGAGKFYTPPVQSAYYRLVYTNGGLPQSSFYLHAVLKAQPFKWSSHNINEMIKGQDDAILTKTVLTAEDEAGKFVNIRSIQGDTGFNLKVSLDQVEQTTNSVQVIDYAHGELHGGTHYIVRKTALLAKNGTKELLVVTPNTTKWAHMVIGLEATDSAVKGYLFEAPTITAIGTLDGARNRNRNVADNNTTLFYENPTVTATGTLLASYHLGSGKTSGGAARDAEEFVLKQNTLYLFRVVEPNVAATNINWTFDWYEHTNK